MPVQNVPVERICEIAEAVAKNTHLEKLHLANTRATDKVANVCITAAAAAVTLLLADRRDKFSRTFSQNMCKLASCLHHLLPPPHNTSAISRLRSSTPYISHLCNLI